MSKINYGCMFLFNVTYTVTCKNNVSLSLSLSLVYIYVSDDNVLIKAQGLSLFLYELYPPSKFIESAVKKILSQSTSVLILEHLFVAPGKNKIFIFRFELVNGPLDSEGVGEVGRGGLLKINNSTLPCFTQ